MLIANSNLVPEWATWEHFRELEDAGLMMYGQMTAGSWIYIGTQGILQGTYETFAAVARQHFGGTLRGPARRHRRARRDGWRAAARGHAERRVRARASRSTARVERRHTRAGTSTRAGSLDDALARLDAPAREGRRSRSACSATPPRSCRSSSAAASRRRGDRPDERPRPARRLRAAGTSSGRAGSGPPIRTSTCGASARARWPTWRRSAISSAPARRVRLRQQRCAAAAEDGDADAFAYPGFVPGLHPAAVLRGQGPVPVGGAVRRPRRHRGHRRGDPRAVRRAGPHPPLDRAGAGTRALPGPAGADLLARLRRAPPRRAALQRAGGLGRGARRRSSSAATTSTPGRSPRRTARRRRCATAPTRSPTGRSSTRW